MQDVFSTLSGIAGELGNAPEGREAIVFAAWRRTSGSLISDHAKVLKFEGATLKVAVRDKTWQRHLAAHSREYLFKINALLKGISVDRIEFVIHPAAFEIKEIVRKNVADEATEPSPEIAASANAIDDIGLREQFLKAAGAAESRGGKK